MTLEQTKLLRPGDKVYWNDPDDGICSRMYFIMFVSVHEDGVVLITDINGSSLECFAEELS